jgi:hypothetical protein
MQALPATLQTIPRILSDAPELLEQLPPIDPKDSAGSLIPSEVFTNVSSYIQGFGAIAHQFRSHPLETPLWIPYWPKPI